MPSTARPIVIPNNLDPLFPTRVVSELQPSSGGLHLGNYFGAVVTQVRLQYEYPGDTFCLVADYHALTSEHQPDRLRESTSALALDYLAVGLEPDRSTLYRQSDVPQVCELMWMLACATRKTRLDNAYAYRSATDRGELASIALFLYPALLAADILGLRGTDVALALDQQQHLEIARESARGFNSRWGPVFPVPCLRSTPVPTVPGIDGRMMSQLYGNVLPVFWQDDEWLEARVMHIVTAPTALGEAVDPEALTVFKLYRLVADEEAIATMRDGLASSKLGITEAKRRLLQALKSYFAPMHERRRRLAEDDDFVEDVLRAGGRRVREETEATLDLVRDAIGLAPYRRRLL
jgi:tryptophanyl-tRNA synthetase